MKTKAKCILHIYTFTLFEYVLLLLGKKTH